MSTIVQYGDPVLRSKASEIDPTDITKEETQELIRNMHSALAEQKDGVALAAPQIGESYRMFVVGKHAYKSYTNDKPLVFINPIITKHSKKQHWVEEGCLSVRWWYGKTYRYKQATIEAYNEQGKKFSYGGSGLLAQIFQHEIDHLNGVLFSDHAKELAEYEPKEESQPNNMNE